MGILKKTTQTQHGVKNDNFKGLWDDSEIFFLHT